MIDGYVWTWFARKMKRSRRWPGCAVTRQVPCLSAVAVTLLPYVLKAAGQ